MQLFLFSELHSSALHCVELKYTTTRCSAVHGTVRYCTEMQGNACKIIGHALEIKERKHTSEEKEFLAAAFNCTSLLQLTV